VLANCGHIELNRMLLGAYSCASDLEAQQTAALLPLYHVSRGFGRVAPVDAILMNEPPLLCSFIHGMITATDR
jgi:hypothetical protein